MTDNRENEGSLPEIEEKDWPFWAKAAKILQRGGLIDPGYLDEFDRCGCGWVREHFRSAKRAHAEDDFSDRIQELSLFFIANDAVNAVALEHEDHQGIGVYLGTVRRLWLMYQNALDSGSFLESSFTQAAPCSSAKSTASPTRFRLWDEEANHGWCKDRLDMFWDLFLRSLDFLVYHEIAHHTRGHIDLVRRHMGVSEVDELLSLSTSDGISGELFRQLEFDADHHGLDMMLTGYDRKFALRDWPEDHARAECFLFSLSLIGVFLVLDFEDKDVEAHYHTTHPAPVHRAMRLTGALSRTIGRFVGWSEDERIDHHDNAWGAGAELAELFGYGHNRWMGEGIERMDIARFEEEEQRFIAFSKSLDIINQQDSDEED